MAREQATGEFFSKGSNAQTTGAIRTQQWDGRVKKVVASSESFGKDTKTILIERPANLDDWLNDGDLIDEGGPRTGFAQYQSMMELQGGNEKYPIEHQFGEMTDIDKKAILEAANEGDPLKGRVSIDPQTRIPDNTSWADMQPESDKFFGDEKKDELQGAMNRSNDIKRRREDVDYKSSSAIPIKVLRKG